MQSCASTHVPKKSVHVNNDFTLFTVHFTTLCCQLKTWKLQKNKSSLQELCHKIALDFHLNLSFVGFGPLCFSNHCPISARTQSSWMNRVFKMRNTRFFPNRSSSNRKGLCLTANNEIEKRRSEKIILPSSSQWTFTISFWRLQA